VARLPGVIRCVACKPMIHGRANVKGISAAD
jgi:hypothetical protein